MIVGSDSLLVQLAREMADRHPPSRGLAEEHWCLRCWAPWPCVAAKHALEVCRAAGLGRADEWDVAGDWDEADRYQRVDASPARERFGSDPFIRPERSSDRWEEHRASWGY